MSKKTTKQALKRIAPQTPRVWVTKQLHFSPHGGHFSLESKADAFLDVLIELCKEPPEYLHSQDARRYVFLLSMMKQFGCRDWDGKELVQMSDPTIRDLCGRGLDIWVGSYVHPDSPAFIDIHREPYGLMPHYVLDAARFVLKHVYGYFGGISSNENRHFRIEPMVKNAPDEFRQFESSSFKSEFTRNVPLIWAKGLVPENACIRIQQRHHCEEPTGFYQAGDSFWLNVSRCHLSIGFQDYSAANVEYKPPEYDISEDFVLYGNLIEGLMVEDGHLQAQDEYPIFIPARWLTHGFPSSSRPSNDDSLEPQAAPWDKGPVLQ